MIFDIEAYINKKLPKNVTNIDISYEKLSKKLTYIPNLLQFKNLISLSCKNNELTSLPELPNSLETLDCRNNQLLSLPKLPEINFSVNSYNVIVLFFLISYNKNFTYSFLTL